MRCPLWVWFSGRTNSRGSDSEHAAVGQLCRFDRRTVRRAFGFHFSHHPPYEAEAGGVETPETFPPSHRCRGIRFSGFLAVLDGSLMARCGRVSLALLGESAVEENERKRRTFFGRRVRSILLLSASTPHSMTTLNETARTLYNTASKERGVHVTPLLFLSPRALEG